jgi:trypsin
MRLKLLIILGGLTTSCFAYLNDTDGSTHHDGIYGGEEIEPGSRPYLVSLGKGSSGLGQFCGGSLISKHAILTAAHCVTEYDENDGSLSWNPPEWVELRRHNLCDDTEDFVRVHLDQTQCSGDVVFHPEYNGTTDDNDVAIVFLSNAIDDIVPVILNSDPNVPAVDDPLDVAGWGEVDDGSYPVIPSSVTLYYLTNEACMSKPFKWGWWMITDNMMCAFAKKKSSCHGDSGQ